MARAESDRDEASRILLGVLSFGFALAAAAILFAGVMARGSEDEVPVSWVLAPVAVAVLGFVAAGIGGLFARVGSVVLGLVTAGSFMWVLVQVIAEGGSLSVDAGLALAGLVVLGVAAVVVPLGPGGAKRSPEDRYSS